MNIYMSLYIWSLLTWGASQSIPKGVQKTFFTCLVFIPLFFILGGRGPNVGTDTSMYNALFYSLQGLFDGSYQDVNIEFSYILISNILGIFTYESQSIIFFYAFFTILTTAWLFCNRSYNLFISTIIFISLFYFENFNGMRQCLSVVLSYVALFQFIHQKKLQGIIINILATFIHSSAMLFFVIFLFYPLNKKKLVVIISLAIVIAYFIQIYGMDIAFHYLADSNKYGGYLLSSQYGASKEIGAGIIKVIGFILTILMAIFVLRKKNLDNDRQEVYYMGLLLLLSCVATIMQYNIMIFYRLIYPFAFSFCFFVPLICKYISFNKYFFYFPTALFLAYYLNRMIVKAPELQYVFWNQ